MSDHNKPNEQIAYTSDMRAWHARDSNFDVNHNGVQRTQTVRNYTNEVIYVQHRDGIPFKLNPEIRANGYEEIGVLIRVRYRYGKNVEVCADNTLNSPANNPTGDVKALQHAARHPRTEDRSSTKTFEVDYFISALDIRKLGGLFYLEQIDLLISTLEGNSIGTHPESRLGKGKKNQQSVELHNNNVGFYYQLRFVDNEGIYGTHYVNINGVVFSIRPIVNQDLHSGIHHYTPTDSISESTNNALVHNSYETIEEGIKKYNLYKTREEALSHGNIKETHVLELQTQKQKIKERELEIEQSKMEMSRELSDLKSEYDMGLLRLKKKYDVENEHRESRTADLKEERDILKDQLEKEQLNRKDHYDQKAYRRKDTSEIIKIIPVVLTAVAGLVGVLVGGRMK